MVPAGVVLFEHSMSSSSLPCRRPAGSCILRVSFFFSLPAKPQTLVSYWFLTLPVTAESCILLVSSFFLSFFLLATLQRLISQTCLEPISTRLGHKNPWPMAFMSYDQSGVKGHEGVTGVKKVKNSKTLLLLQITWYGHVTHVYASAWPPSTKVMGLEIYPGSFGVTRVKSSFSLKML